MDEAQEELAVRHALGELSPAEARRLRAALEHDPELAALSRELQEAFASLALTVPPRVPPAGLPARIVRAEPKASPRGKVIPLAFVPWALAACLALMGAVLATERLRTGQEVAALRNREAFLQWQLADLRQRDVLSQMRIATLQAKVATYAQTQAVVVWDTAKKAGLIQFGALPAPQPGKAYQLWVIDARSPQPVSAGLVPPTESGLVRVAFKPAQAVGSAAQFAVSVEEAGGSPAPRGPIILFGQ
jgi:anti-sigma-K factor RskA